MIPGIGIVGDWLGDALCAQTGIHDEMWFPGKGQSPQLAKSVCVKCPAVADCLAWALENHEEGVWGATTAEDRKRIRAGKEPPLPQLCNECGRTFKSTQALGLHSRTHETRCRRGHDLTLPGALYQRTDRRECRACRGLRENRRAAA